MMFSLLPTVLVACGPRISSVPADWPAGEQAQEQAAMAELQYIVRPPVRKSQDPMSEILSQFLAALSYCNLKFDPNRSDKLGRMLGWSIVSNYRRYPSETFAFRCPETGEVSQ